MTVPMRNPKTRYIQDLVRVHGNMTCKEICDITKYSHYEVQGLLHKMRNEGNLHVAYVTQRGITVWRV